MDIAGAVLSGRTRSMGWLRRPRPADRAAVDEALELVGLADLRRRPIGELSGGQRQRVLVARSRASPDCCSWASRSPAWTSPPRNS
ncbi:ATP-binding cassette domain-containing protein [Streptomyces umbrinus]|uniref:ATP-binding cassette domain-containing protein n=1 Tax=Streptomyces umbrinus TaxID=67370 RepID=UPI003416D1C7